MKLLNYIYVPILILFQFSLALSAEKSSEIPDQRLFPISTKYAPCEDFHKYVCDEVESSFKLREDRNRHAFAFNDSAERILTTKKKFFSQISKEKNLSDRSLQIKNYYLACMDQKSGSLQEKAYLKKLTTELSNIQTIPDFFTLQLQNIKNGRGSLIQFETGSNQDHPEIADLFLSTRLMNLPEHSYYENPELMQNYKKLLLTFFKIAYPKNSELENQKKAEQLISFEKEFVHIFPKPEIQRQRWSERRQQTQADFIKTYPQIPFTQILAEVPSARTVFNALPEALQFLNNKATAENLNTLKDFYLYSIVSSKMDDAFPKFFEQKFEFNRKYLGGANQRPDRQERCTRTVMETFPKELDQMMIPKIFPHFPTDKFNAVATKIRDSIISGLNKNQWLQPETKAKAILKIKMAQLYLVQPQNDLEWDFLPVQNFSAKNKIDNSTLFSKNYFKKQITDLNQGINLKAWAMGPLTVNAYYDSSANKFVMPIGILQYPFFNAEGDLIENLGAVGAVIGHELGHGIDDEGSRYDEKGRLQQWMTMKDMKEFSDRSRKLITLFNKAGHNGALTIGENIGDLVGLTFAYNAAFENAKPTKDDQKKLFISYARLWCNVTRPKTAELQLKTNPHALGWARINEQVKHQKSFAEAFDCRSGDPMTLPESERVKIW